MYIYIYICFTCVHVILGSKSQAAMEQRNREWKLLSGGCQNYGPFLEPYYSTLDISCRIIIGIQKGDKNFDNHPYTCFRGQSGTRVEGLGYRFQGAGSIVAALNPKP